MADAPWMLDISRRRFGSDFDQIACEGWFFTEVLPKYGLYLPIRTSNAFLIALLNSMPWEPSVLRAHVLLLVSDEDAVWEAIRLLRASVEWARSRKCKSWHYHWDEGDALTLCARVGAMCEKRYRIDLEG